MTKNILDNLWQHTLTFEKSKDYKLTVGALELYVRHLENEWQFRYRHLTGNETEKEQKVSLSEVKNIQEDKLELMRFIHPENTSLLNIKPALANRNIVAKPHMPVFLPSKQSVIIYISTPVWLEIHLNKQPHPLLELPSFKLSDTWFGPKPHIGELCYSSRFSGRTDLSALPKRASRIITPVKIINNGNDNLKLEKIAIPSDYLTIYQNTEGELWTPALVIRREVDKNNTRVDIEKNIHTSLAEAVRIAEPRNTDKSGLFSKTIDMLFA